MTSYLPDLKQGLTLFKGTDIGIETTGYTIKYKMTYNQLELSISRKVLGINSKTINFYFK